MLWMWVRTRRRTIIKTLVVMKIRVTYDQIFYTEELGIISDDMEVIQEAIRDRLFEDADEVVSFLQLEKLEDDSK